MTNNDNWHPGKIKEEDREEELRLKILFDCDNDENLIKFVELYMNRFRRLGTKNERIFRWCSIAVLAASVSIPLMNTIFPSESYPWLLPIITSSLAFISALAVRILQIEQAQDRMTLERVTKVLLEREIIMFKNGSGPYSGTGKRNGKETEIKQDENRVNLSTPEQRKVFAQNIADIIVNKFNKYYSIDRRDNIQWNRYNPGTATDRANTGG